MTRSWKIGRAFGIPIYIHPTFLLLAPLAVWQAPPGDRAAAIAFSLLLFATVFGCVLLHELGHALVARSFGIGTRDIILSPIGGMARLEQQLDRPSDELWIALAGPAVNFALAFLLTPALVWLALVGEIEPTSTINLAAGWQVLLGQFLTLLWLANLVLGTFNLVPALPMDGGRVLRAVLSYYQGPLRATEIAAMIGLVMAGGIAALAFVNQNPIPLFLSAFVVFAGRLEVLHQRARDRLRRERLPEPTASESSPLLTALPHLQPHRPGFTGVTWHRQLRAWVRWDGGRAIAVYAERAE